MKILTLSAGRSSCITRKRSNRGRRYKLETDIVLFRNNVRGISHFVHTERPRENVLLSFWSQRYNCTNDDLSKRSWENNKGSAIRVGTSRRRGIRRDLVGSGDGREGATISDSIVVIGDE